MSLYVAALQESNLHEEDWDYRPFHFILFLILRLRKESCGLQEYAGTQGKISITKNTKVCSLHFKPQDFVYSELQIESSRPRLKPNAVPSVFAWTTHFSQHTTVTSKIAASLQQRCDLRTDHENSSEVSNCDSHDIDTSNADAYTATDTVDSRVQELELEVRELKAERNELELEVKQLKDKLHRSEKQLFCLENIKQTDSLIKFYTGFPDFETLMIFMRKS